MYIEMHELVHVHEDVRSKNRIWTTRYPTSAQQL